MQNHERAMMAYALLAKISHRKLQFQGRDKFLILTAAAACRAGWPDVATACRTLILKNNPAHLVGGYELFTDAMRSGDFMSFLKQVERFCSYERAEFLLDELGIVPEVPESAGEKTSGKWLLEKLEEMSVEG